MKKAMMMRPRQIATLLSLTALALVAASYRAPAQAPQTPNNDTLAATMKAAIFVEGKGRVAVEAGNFSLRIELAAQGKGRDAAQAEYQRSLDTVTRVLTKTGMPILPADKSQVERRGDASDETKPEQPDDLFGAYGTVVAHPRSLEEMRSTLAALRATGVNGVAVILFSAKNPDTARLAAFKVAIVQAKLQALALGDTVKPKEFDLLYIKQGTYVSSFRGGRVALNSTDPLPNFTPVEAEMTATLFYGFKPTTAKSAMKTTKKKVIPVRVAVEE